MPILQLSPSSSRQKLEDKVFRVPEYLRVKKALTPEGSGTLIKTATGKSGGQSKSGDVLSTWLGPAVSHIAANAAGALIFAMQDDSLWRISLSKRDTEQPIP